MSRDPFHIRIVRSDGREMSFGDGTYWVLSMNGMADWIELDHDVSTEAATITDGSYVIGKRIAEKDRTLRAVYWGRDRKGVRDEVISFFNPKFTFQAYLTYFQRTRWCEGEQIGFDCPIVDHRTPPSITWTLLCSDPYLRDGDGNENSLSDSVPMFGFPFVSHIREPLPDGTRYPEGFLASKTLFDGLNTVYNNGDVETAYKIVCEFTGTVTNPKFIKDEKFVQVLDTFMKGDMLEIDFTAAPPRVEKNGNNVIQLTSRDSTFIGMEMGTGPNVFNYTCSNESLRPLMIVQIQFWKRYLGM